MVHPSELFRTNSEDETSHFSAPINAVSKQEIDCGFSAFPWITSRWNLEKFAKPSVYLMCLCILGFLNGTVVSYFQSTSYIWRQEYNFSKYTTDWILYADDIFVGLFALVIAYWGSKIHKMSWIGALIIYHALAGWFLIVPELHRKTINQVAIQESNSVLCNHENMNRSLSSLTMNSDEENQVILAIFILYQMFVAGARIAFITLGITYLDDSISLSNSAACISLPFAAEQIGIQIGMYSSWLPISLRDPSIFVSPVWLIPYTLLFLIGAIIAMFPHTLPSVMIKTATHSILNILQGIEETETPKNERFSRLVLHVLKNKVIMLNIFAFVFLYAAVFNFYHFEYQYYRSRFLLPVLLWDSSGYTQPFSLQITSNLVLQPVIALAAICCGMVISKYHPHAKKLATWNVAVAVLAALSLSSYACFKCGTEIQSELHNKISIPFCSSHCLCPKDFHFSPVCVNEGKRTFFSPCQAGCKGMEEANGVKIYNNCTCGRNIHTITNTKASDGACNNCVILWSLVQFNRVIISGLLATMAITILILNLRTLPSPYKPIILGLQLTLAFAINNVIFRVVSSTFAEYTCKYKQENGMCDLHSESFNVGFPLYIAFLLLLSGAFSMAITYSINDLDLYKTDSDENDSEKEIEESEHENEENADTNKTPMQNLRLTIGELRKSKLFHEQSKNLNSSDSEDSIQITETTNKTSVIVSDF